MTAAARLNAPAPLDQLPITTASSVKTAGWRGTMRALSAQGKLLVTNHNQPEAVILSTAEYMRLIAAATAAEQGVADPLWELRRRFDERLAVLNENDAGDRLRAIMNQPRELNGTVKAGSTY